MKEINSVIEAVDRLKNARFQIEQDRDHLDGKQRTYASLAMGLIEHSISYLLVGTERFKGSPREGMYSALLQCD